MIRQFEELAVWKKARELTRLIYHVTGDFRQDPYLKNQMRAAAVSLMSNIAEGFNRNSDREFVRFLFIAKSSAAEIQSQCYVALDQKYLPQIGFDRLYEVLDHESRMISNLIKHLRKSTLDGTFTTSKRQ